MALGSLNIREDAPAPSAYGKVYDILLNLIISFKLKPFALLSEKAVSDALHVSRSPVREALARLATVGLVDIYAQRGSIVAPLRVKDLQHSQFLRECVEVGLLHKACQLPDRSELSKQLKGEIALQETLAAIGDFPRFSKSDELFHQYIAVSVGFPDIWTDISNAKLHMNRFRNLTYPDMDSLTTIIAQHKKIADAIERGSEADATKAMQEHLRKIFPLIPDLIKKFPEYFEETNDPAGRIHRPDLTLVTR
ncbi:HTH-type transcriptional repressor RspR [Ensifer adhaerens]|uniref:GntR family transcriptional regulator n=1 Tax=Ensifer adhaerens TaxID=106592 RepID=UPI001AEE1DC3|nr:GntR family transcriptional regulator [Ensifer adhaerens]NRP21790.1 HTH-type transcriptional repressor RspR [Ensifer adhaerens]